MADKLIVKGLDATTGQFVVWSNGTAGPTSGDAVIQGADSGSKAAIQSGNGNFIAEARLDGVKITVNGQVAGLWDANGNAQQGLSSTTPTSTNGFLYMPSGLGPPTGVPTAISGYTPVWTDSSNNQIYFYNSGWKQASPSPGWYGNRQHGAAHFDGFSTVSGLVPVGGVYVLTQDFYWTTVLIDAGVIIETNGYRIVAATSIINNGTISNKGNNAIANVAGVATHLGTAGNVGEAGATGPVASGNGPKPGNITNSYGGNGGAGGNAGANTGGISATATNPSATASLLPFQMPFSGWGVTGSQSGSGFFNILGINGGAGGSAGALAAGATNSKGGGGGGGGGLIILLSPSITNSATGVIIVDGGIGGNGTAGADGIQSGGGGGGGGGAVIINALGFYSNAGTISVNGGTFGTGGNGGSNGSAGNPGTLLLLLD